MHMHVSAIGGLFEKCKDGEETVLDDVQKTSSNHLFMIGDQLRNR